MAKFILSKSKAFQQYNSIKDLGMISYSFKTNPRVGELLEQNTDCSLSVHFINELKLIKDKSRVWFLAQSLNKDSLDDIFTRGVRRFVIENEQDLNTLLTYLDDNDENIELLLRMKLKENTVKTEKHYVFGMVEQKVNELIPLLDNNKRIKKLGVHVHRKTQNVSEWDLVRELEELIEESNWKRLDYVNVGGGIPVMYKNITDKIIPTVLKKISELKEWLKKKQIQLIIEPGRYISGPSVILETNIVGIHANTIVVDASVYNSSPDTLIVPIKLLVQGEVEEHEGKPYVIKGITPCSTDLFRYRVYLKKEPVVGEKMTFLNAGAYNFHTEFCELDKVETLIVD
jgi:ornithine decarboxylase